MSISRHGYGVVCLVYRWERLRPNVARPVLAVRSSRINLMRRSAGGAGSGGVTPTQNSSEQLSLRAPHAPIINTLRPTGNITTWALTLGPPI